MGRGDSGLWPSPFGRENNQANFRLPHCAERPLVRYPANRGSLNLYVIKNKK